MSCEIYLIRNKIDGKSYVGKTSSSIEARFRQHVKNGRAPRTHVDWAIKKYGACNFAVELLDSIENVEEIDELEDHWIDVLGSLAPNGYNSRKNGRGRSGASGYSHDALARKKISVMSSRPRRPLSRETREKIGFANRERGHPAVNRKLSDEAVRKIRFDPRCQEEIASEFEVSQGVVSAVKRRITYKDVD